MDSGTIGWIALAIAVLVFFDLLIVEIRRALREAKRIVRRLQGYAELPLFSLLAASEHDTERLNGALEQIPVLLERARSALETIRHPLAATAPPEARSSSPDVEPDRD